MTSAGVSPIEAKIKVVQEWDTPPDVKDVWSFLILPTTIRVHLSVSQSSIPSHRSDKKGCGMAMGSI